MKRWNRIALLSGIVALAVVALGATVVFGGPSVSPWGQGPGGYPGGGMMGGYGGMMGSGMMGGDMMGPGYGFSSQADPLSIEQATAAVESYLNQRGDDNLQVGEVMVFTNHTYVQVVEKDTGIRAFEVLVDNTTLAIYPEMGPNMMWNLRYGYMAGGTGGTWSGGCHGSGAGGWMMGGLTSAQDPTGDMPITPEQAIVAAQEYLGAREPGAQAGQEADAFYGYYTIHVRKDGETIGMLSINGYTGQAFYHFWHGDLVKMEEGT